MIDALKDNVTHNWWTNEDAIDVYGNCGDAASKYSFSFTHFLTDL